MQFTPAVLSALAGRFSPVKVPAVQTPPAQRDPAVAARVSGMLADIEEGGLDAVLRYAAELDGYDGSDGSAVELDADTIARSGERLPPSCARRSNSVVNAPGPSPRPSART